MDGCSKIKDLKKQKVQEVATPICQVEKGPASPHYFCHSSQLLCGRNMFS